MNALAGLLALAVVATTTAGCGDTGSTSGRSSGESSWSPWTSSSPSAPPEPCTTEHPTPLGIELENFQEFPYRNQIDACASEFGTSVMIVNGSDTVWTLATTGLSSQVEQLTQANEARLFREAVRSVYPYEVMAPRSTVVVHAEPKRVSWHLAPGLGVLWLAQEQLIDTIRDVAIDQATEALARTSPRRSALLACGVLAYEIAKFDGSGLREGDPAQALLEGLGVAASGTECARRWLYADDDALRRFGKAPRWESEVAALTRDAEFLGRANGSLSLARRAAKALLVVLPG